MYNFLQKALMSNCNITAIVAPEDIKQAKLIAKFSSEFLSDNNIKKSKNLDDYIYISPKANYDSLDDLRYAISSCAVFTNDFDGVIAINISNFLPLVKDSICADLLEYLSTLHNKTTLLLLVDGTAHRNFPVFLYKLNTYLDDEVLVIDARAMSQDKTK